LGGKEDIIRRQKYRRQNKRNEREREQEYQFQERPAASWVWAT
jgi:hypothetical protein